MQQMACKLWNKNSVKQMQDVVYSDHYERRLQIKLEFWLVVATVPSARAEDAPYLSLW
jgi:hypothetical protein